MLRTLADDSIAVFAGSNSRQLSSRDKVSLPGSSEDQVFHTYHLPFTGCRDNQFIYLEAVTAAAQLSPIVPAATVTPTIPPAVLNPIAHLHNREGGLGKPYFEALVPWEVNHAVKIYKDRKEVLLQDEFVGKKKELDAHAARFVDCIVNQSGEFCLIS